MAKKPAYKKKSPKTSKSVKSTTKIVKKVLRSQAEHKFTLLSMNTVVLAAGVAQLFDASSMIQGTTESTRVGLQIQPTSAMIRAAAFSTAAGNAIIRVIFFRWHPDTAVAAPSFAQLMGPGSNGVAQDVYSNYNVNNASQYTILLDHTFRASVGSGLVAPMFIKRWNPGKAKVSYNTGAAVTTGENHLHLAVISDAGAILIGTNLMKYIDI